MDAEAYLSKVVEKPAKYAAVPISIAADILGLTRAAVLEKARSGSLASVRITVGDKSRRLVLAKALATVVHSEKEARKSLLPQIRAILGESAREHCTIRYADLMSKVGLTYRNPSHRKKIGELLGRVSETSLERDGFLLSALAVRKTTNRPNDAFFQLAQNVGLLKEEDQEKFWQQQAARIYRHYARS